MLDESRTHAELFVVTVCLVKRRTFGASFFVDIARSGIAAVDQLLHAVVRIVRHARGMVLLLVIAFLIDSAVLSASSIRQSIPVFLNSLPDVGDGLRLRGNLLRALGFCAHDDHALKAGERSTSMVIADCRPNSRTLRATIVRR